MDILILGSAFNQPVDHLPPKLLRFEISGDQTTFDQPVDHLPETLQIFKPGPGFNQSIENLPDGLETLVLRCKFARPIITLPSALKTLFFGCCFNHPVQYLPASLEDLSFGVDFNSSISSFPPLIKSLAFQGYLPEGQHIGARLPRKLEHLEVCLSLGDHLDLPASLRVLRFNVEEDENGAKNARKFLHLFRANIRRIPKDLEVLELATMRMKQNGMFIAAAQ